MQDLTKLVVYSAHTTATVNRIPKVTVSQHQVLSSKQSKLRAIPKYFSKFYCPIGQYIIAKHYADTAAIIRS